MQIKVTRLWVDAQGNLVAEGEPAGSGDVEGGPKGTGVVAWRSVRHRATSE